MTELLTLCREMGLGVVLSVALFTAFFFLLKWVLDASATMLKRMDAERQAWQQTHADFIRQLDALQIQGRENLLVSKAFFDAVKDDHKAQSAEHKEMIQVLGRINGYKDHT